MKENQKTAGASQRFQAGWLKVGQRDTSLAGTGKSPGLLHSGTRFGSG